MSLLRHNQIDSLVRRPSGINDDEWNAMIEESINLTVANQTSFFYEMALFCIKNKSKQIYENILELFGISEATKEEFITKTNMEHFMFRGFRHFCPENMRNALNHSLMPFARLVACHDGKHHTEFKWLSEKSFELRNPTELTASINASVGDEVVVVAWGHADVESIRIYVTNGESLEYYCKGRSKSFGNIMYKLKKTMLANR